MTPKSLQPGEPWCCCLAWNTFDRASQLSYMLDPKSRVLQKLKKLDQFDLSVVQAQPRDLSGLAKHVEGRFAGKV